MASPENSTVEPEIKSAKNPPLYKKRIIKMSKE
jgi:hypothetical protein